MPCIPARRLIARGQEHCIVKTGKHSWDNSLQSSTQLDQATGPVLEQNHTVVKLDKTHAIVSSKVRSKAFRRVSEVVEVACNRGRSIDDQSNINRNLAQAEIA